MSRDEDWILCTATLLEDPMHPSPTTLEDQVAAAREAGFAGLSLWTHFWEGAKAAGRTEEDLCRILEDSGLRVPILEALLPWDAASESGAVAEAERSFALAERLGSQHVVVVTMNPAPLEWEAAVERYRSLCDAAAARGIGAMIEFLPWSGIPDLATAWRMIEDADRPNAQLMIDTWHWQRQPGGPDPELLRRIPGDRIAVVQLCDSRDTRSLGTQDEAMSGRLLPGDGSVDFRAFFGLLDEIGANPLLAPEVFNTRLAGLGMRPMAQQIFDSCRRVVAAARGDSRNEG